MSGKIISPMYNRPSPVKVVTKEEHNENHGSAKKLKPMEFKLEKIFKDRTFYICPKCESDLHQRYNKRHCGNCEQRIDWSDIE